MPDGPAELGQRLEHVLLGGRRRYTRLEVAERAGVSSDRTRALWRSLGFASVGDEDVVFTDADVEAVRIADSLVRAGVLDPGIETSVTRALGQHLSRLAEWQTTLLREMITAHPELAADERRIVEVVEQILPQLETVQNLVWRRHLAAYAGRQLAAPDEELEERNQVVGFVDMVGYTRMTRRVGEAELAEVLDRFETLTTEVLAEHGGRVVKMIGDEVLFVVDDTRAAAEIALTLAERAEADERLPSLRTGLASGRILSRFGDVYGSVVNLASRLTALAKPGKILVDKELAAELADEPGYQVRSRRPVSVRGYHRLRPSVLRRA